MRHPSYARAQGGQSLLEGMVALLVLSSIWVGVTWVGRLQDIALTTQHASGRAAFAAARQDTAGLSDRLRKGFFDRPAHRWADRAGSRLLAATPDDVLISLDRDPVLSLLAQPGGPGSVATQLRSDWALHDTGLVTARVVSRPSSGGLGHNRSGGILGLRILDISLPVLARHTSILVGAGHASADTSVQRILRQSGLAWSGAADASKSAGRMVAGIMNDVDAGWDRSTPDFDWLLPWAGRVPGRHLSRTGGSDD